MTASARYAQENLQTTPLAITAVTGVELENRNSTSIAGLEDKAVVRQGQLLTSRPGDNAFLMPPRQSGVSVEWNLSP